MKHDVLCILPTLELNNTLGVAPYYNQFISNLRDIAHVQVVESLRLKSSIFERAIQKYFWHYTRPYKYMNVLQQDTWHPDLILIMQDFRFLHKGNMKQLRKIYPDARIIFYDVDAPVNFPEYMTNPNYGKSSYRFVDLSQTDGVIIPSAGCKKDMMERFGAPDVETMYFSIDPEWYPTNPRKQIYDVTYLGLNTYYREHAIREMVTIPSQKMQDKVFVVTSNNHFDFGNAEVVPKLTFDYYTTFPRQSKINLSITRDPFTMIYASSISRIFELAAMKSCIVSNNCEGLTEWYQPDKEVLVVHNALHAIDTYTYLLENEEERRRLAENAYQRTMRDHTIKKRLQGLSGWLWKTN